METQQKPVPFREYGPSLLHLLTSGIPSAMDHWKIHFMSALRDVGFHPTSLTYDPSLLMLSFSSSPELIGARAKGTVPVLGVQVQSESQGESKEATAWLEKLAVRIRVQRSASLMPVLVTETVDPRLARLERYIDESRPFEPIPLSNKSGECFEDIHGPGFHPHMGEDAPTDAKLHGQHGKYCRGAMSSIQISDDWRVLVCQKCHRSFEFPIAADVTRSMRAYFVSLLAPDEDSSDR